MPFINGSETTCFQTAIYHITFRPRGLKPTGRFLLYPLIILCQEGESGTSRFILKLTIASEYFAGMKPFATFRATIKAISTLSPTISIRYHGSIQDPK